MTALLEYLDLTALLEYIDLLNGPSWGPFQAGARGKMPQLPPPPPPPLWAALLLLTPASFNMVIIAALPKRATIHGDTIQVLPDITRDFSSDNYLNILRESGDARLIVICMGFLWGSLFLKL